MIPESPLGLRIPEQTAPPHDTVVLDPDKTESWIAHLPLANVGETSRRVFKAIVECNRFTLPDQTRLKVMEQFLEPTKYITNNLEKHYIGAAFPLSPKSRKIAVLARELQVEVAISYKIIVTNILDSHSSGRFDKKLLIIAIYRALSYLSKALLHTYLVYDTHPENAWREIHRLASYALQNQLHDVPMKSGKRDKSARTINNLYIETLLLSLAEPQRLRQKEILLVSDYLGNWNQLSQLLPAEAVEGNVVSEGLFFSDLCADTPPVHYLSRPDHPIRNFLLLNTRELTGHLESLIDRPTTVKATEEELDAGLDLTLLKKLIKVWSAPHTRKHARTRLHFRLKVAVGLNAIYGLMTADEEKTDKRQVQQQPPEDSGWVRQTDMLLHTLKSGFLNTGRKLDLSLSPLGDSTAQTNRNPEENEIFRSDPDDNDDDEIDVWSSRTPVSYDTHVFRTLDESAGGYRISWNGSDIPRISVGELIGIQSAGNANQFGVTLVKWMKNTPRQVLHLGMQMLAPNALAVEIEPTEGEQDKPEHCLLLPEMRASSLSASLITPVMRFKEGDLLTLIEAGNKRRIRLNRQTEETGAFSQFQFAYLRDEGRGDPLISSDDPDDDYGSIWSTL